MTVNYLPSKKRTPLFMNWKRSTKGYTLINRIVTVLYLISESWFSNSYSLTWLQLSRISNKLRKNKTSTIKMKKIIGIQISSSAHRNWLHVSRRNFWIQCLSKNSGIAIMIIRTFPILKFATQFCGKKVYFWKDIRLTSIHFANMIRL